MNTIILFDLFQHVTKKPKPKSESELILQTTMSLAEIKALEWVEGVKVFFILNYFKSKSL